MRWNSATFLTAFFLLLFTTSVFAQDICPELVQTALTSAELSCGNARRDELCYGNLNLEAVPYPNSPPFDFAAPGDITAISHIQTLRLDGMDVSSGSWGVALMKVQANVVDSNILEDVSVILFGDVQIDNQVAPTTELTAFINTDRANIRLTPSTDAGIVSSLARDESVTVIGRNSDSSWLQVRLDGIVSSWIFADLVNLEGDINSLDVIASENYSTSPRPMQAFTFRSASDDRPCDQAPDSGLMIQTPSGVGEISFLINEVDIRLGSTAYLTTSSSDEGNQLQVSLIEGHARIEADGIAQYLTAGQTLTVPLDDSFIAQGQPTSPQPYDGSSDALPIPLLEVEVSIPDAYSPAPNVPVITAVELEGQGTSTITEDIFFTDADGDATTLNIGLLDISDYSIDFRVEGSEINLTPEQQMDGVLQRRLVCTQGTEGVEAQLWVTITDAQGHESNIVEYRISCAGE